jgi:hypothetical protein
VTIILVAIAQWLLQGNTAKLTQDHP